MKRRDFINASGLLALGGLTASKPLIASSRSLTNGIKVALIGCGGRGAGAAVQALQADSGVTITALADIFEDRLVGTLEVLRKIGGERVDVPRNRQFLGFDAYEKAIDADVDVVLLATPPYFRPQHLAAVVAKGRHVFCEKPLAVDAPGLRRVFEAVKQAKAKSLALVSGFCFRYDQPKRAVFDQVLDRRIGEILSVNSCRFGGELPYTPRQSGWSDLAYKLRNWHYYHWLSGDIMLEQSIHSLDMMLWALGGRLPQTAIGTGGRQVRTDAKYGNIYDHFAVEFEFANGIKGFHATRQQPGCANRNTVQVVGSTGTAEVEVGRTYAITGGRPWQYGGTTTNMYQTQHDELFASIRQGRPINDGNWAANSTLLALMCTLAAYGGQEVTWQQVLDSELTFGPDPKVLDWDTDWPTAPVAIPGVTKVL